jgi:tRNA(fMet)-specific endonuclease VapC
MRYMLDTDISSYIIKGGYGAVERRLLDTLPSDICISAVTRAELMYGLKTLSATHRLHAAVHRFLKVTTALAWDAEAADLFAEIKFKLRSAGTPIGEMDMLIAAHALAADATLVTNNTRHYEQIRMPLVLENWME